MRNRLYAVIPILLFVLSISAFADSAADLKRASDTAAVKAAIAAKDWDKASSLIDAFAVSCPDIPAIPHFFRGALCQAQGDIHKALSEIEHALGPAKGVVDHDWSMIILKEIKTKSKDLSANDLESLGNCFRLDFSWSDAADCYEQARAKGHLPPDQDKRIRRWLIEAHINVGQWDKVEKEIDPDSADFPELAAYWHYMLGKRYHWAGNFHQGDVQFSKAIEAHDRLPNAGPGLISMKAMLIKCYLGEYEWDAAHELVAKCIKDYPDNMNVWHHLLGAVLQGEGKYGDAISELKQSIELCRKPHPGAILDGEKDTPNFVRTRLAQCYAKTMTAEEAIPLVQDMVTEYPDTGPDLLLVMAHLYAAVKDYDRSIATFKDVVVRYPASWQVRDALYYAWKESYLPMGRSDEGLAYMRDFYARHTELAMDYVITYGYVLFAQDKNDEAVRFFTKALVDHPHVNGTNEVRRMLLRACTAAKRIDLGINTLDEIIADAPPEDKPALMLARGDIYLKAKKYKEAAGEYESVLSLSRSAPQTQAKAHYELALCYWHSGMNAAAKRGMETVITRYGNTQWAQEARGALYSWETGQ